jgi:hypothetical protein
MLDKIEAELANEKLEAAKEEHLRRRAEIIRGSCRARSLNPCGIAAPSGVADPDALVPL